MSQVQKSLAERASERLLAVVIALATAALIGVGAWIGGAIQDNAKAQAVIAEKLEALEKAVDKKDVMLETLAEKVIKLEEKVDQLERVRDGERR